MQHNTTPIGTMELIIGPMFSGKTTRLIAQISRYSIAHKRCAVIRHSVDTRYEELRTHCGQCCKAANIINCTSIKDVLFTQTIRSPDYDVIGIDETQFFAYDEKSTWIMAREIDDACMCGKTIICAGLDTNWLREPYNYISGLVSRADVITKLRAICMRCDREAIYSARKPDSGADGNPIGGADKYEALCRRCYIANL
jgi:thymidine kinase